MRTILIIAIYSIILEREPLDGNNYSWLFGLIPIILLVIAYLIVVVSVIKKRRERTSRRKYLGNYRIGSDMGNKYRLRPPAKYRHQPNSQTRENLNTNDDELSEIVNQGSYDPDDTQPIYSHNKPTYSEKPLRLSGPPEDIDLPSFLPRFRERQPRRPPAAPCPTDNSFAQIKDGIQVWNKNRYGRVEYFSPMEMNKEYSLRVALLLERHAKNISQDARVRFASLNIPMDNEEPIIKIIPYSSHLKISPPSREVILHKSKEPVADFLILIDHLPENPTNEFDLQIDFEIQGELIKRIPIKITAQRQFCLGKIHFSHNYWRLFGILGSILVALDTGAGLVTTAGFGSIVLPFRIIIFVLAFLFLGFAAWLFSRASRRRKMILNSLVR